MNTKNPQAQALGKMRWKGKTKKEKLAHIKIMNDARAEKRQKAK